MFGLLADVLVWFKTIWGRVVAAAIALASSAFLVGFVTFLITIDRGRNDSGGTSLAFSFAPGAPAVALGDAPPADAVIVLTGGEARIAEGLRLLREGHPRRLLISGVHMQTTRDDLRRRADIDRAFFDCCVDIGYLARDTVGNADEARIWNDIWRFERLVVVTAHYHVPRAQLEFERALPTTVFHFHAVTPKLFSGSGWWRNPHALAVAGQEYVKLLTAFVRRGGSGVVHGAVARARPVDVDLEPNTQRQAPISQEGTGGARAENPVGRAVPRL